MEDNIKLTDLTKVQKPKKAFFFLRHNNDIDHVTPVLYKWLSTENIPTDIIITTTITKEANSCVKKWRSHVIISGIKKYFNTVIEN